jgi:hypothetical protein
MVNATLSADDQAMGRLTPEDVSVRSVKCVQMNLIGSVVRIFVQGTFAFSRPT